MARIDIVHPHRLPVPDVRSRLSGFSDLLARYGGRLEWSGAHARFAGVPGVQGQVQVGPGDVRVEVTVSRLVTMMGLDPKRLEATIRKRLEEALADAPPAGSP